MPSSLNQATDLGFAILSMSLKRSDRNRSATPTTTPAISAPRIALDRPLNDGKAGSTHKACSRESAPKNSKREGTE